MNVARQIGMHKAILWEEAKGKMRAMYMVNGQSDSENKANVEWSKVRTRVEEFIIAFEDDGLQY